MVVLLLSRHLRLEGIWISRSLPYFCCCITSQIPKMAVVTWCDYPYLAIHFEHNFILSVGFGLLERWMKLKIPLS